MTYQIESFVSEEENVFYDGYQIGIILPREGAWTIALDIEAMWDVKQVDVESETKLIVTPESVGDERIGDLIDALKNDYKDRWEV